MPSAPLAGRPPFATDDPDSTFITAPLATKRVAQPKPDNPNNRTSAYDMYDNYLPDGAPAKGASKNPFENPSSSSNNLRPPKPNAAPEANRQSGVGGIGMGLLNMDYSDSEDDDDDAPPRKPSGSANKNPASNSGTSLSPSKNAALLAAIGNIGDHSSSSSKSSPTKPTPGLTINSAKANTSAPPPPALSPFDGPATSPPPIAAPRPGYAAPMPAKFGQNPFDTPVTTPLGPNGPQNPPGLTRLPSSRIPPPQPIGGVPTPVPQSPIAIPGAAHMRGGPNPAVPMSLSPAPLQAPATPIMPVFALPRKSTSDRKEGGVKFEAGSGSPLPRNKPIMRSQNEDPLLPRRGEKGDDFWRRFSMIAREEGPGTKPSSWLSKTKNGTNTLARWVWIVGMILLLAVIGAIVLGVVLNSSKEEAPKEPTILAGNTSKVAGPAETAVPVGGNAGSGGTTRSVLHVSPTLTIDARGLAGLPVPVHTNAARGVAGLPVPVHTNAARGLAGLPVPVQALGARGLAGVPIPLQTGAVEERNVDGEVRRRRHHARKVRRWD